MEKELKMGFKNPQYFFKAYRKMYRINIKSS